MSLLVEELKTWGRIGVKRMISRSLMDRLRRSRVKAKRSAARQEQGTAAPPVTQVQIEAQLIKLGVKPGRDLLVHSALSRMGPVEGGAQAVIQALMNVVGPEATIIMPAYPIPATMYEWMSDPVPFCLRRTPSRMGALTEVFRTMPGVLRSAHPTHSVAAFGPAAEAYTRHHHQVLTPCGPGSSFRLHTDRGGDILCIGTGVGKITSYHVVEDYLDDFPLRIYLDRRMGKDVIMADGARQRVEITVGNPRLSPWRVDNFKPKEVEFRGHLRSYDVLTEGTLGQGQAHLLDGPCFHAMMVDLVAKGITIYHTPKLGGRLALS
jgi:aminoglycoside 3-N-acetyltransferase